MPRILSFLVLSLGLCFATPARAKEPAAISAASSSAANEQIHRTVDRAIGYLQTESAAWLNTRKCAACHHVPMPLWALSVAERQGYAIDKKFVADTTESLLGSKTKLLASKIFPNPADPPDPRPQGNGLNMGLPFLAVAAQSMSSLKEGQEQCLNLIAEEIVKKQQPDGSWEFFATLRRPPINECQTTDAAWIIMALEGLTGTDAPKSVSAALSRARAWLDATKRSDLHQDKVMKVLMAARSARPRATTQATIYELLALQRADGGWSQTVPELKSDAFATGQTLYALSLAGYTADRPEIKRGIDFLVATQTPDGSWPMISRSTPDGSPGSSKLLTPIICAASSWATLGLTAFAPKSPERTASDGALATTPSDAIDDFVRAEMQKRQIPGLSLAIIQDGKIVKATGYGATVKGGDVPVTPATLFQAGSISKPVSALGALRLVEHGKLSLDQDVNGSLRTWKVPENEFTREKKVTLRGILSHSAGLTVHGFPGYATDAQVPTLVQVLNGEKPANTAPIRVDILPGSKERYSGGGYTVAQQMTIDVTGKPFPQFMQETVLGPLEMRSSTFEQPLPAEKAKITATAHARDRSPVKGRWHIYPEMAAAGLWTTPSDLARFAIGVQEALSGKSRQTVSQQMARQMLTEQRKGTGLGFGLRESGNALRFQHGGRDEGFDALLVACAETGQGAVIMINTNDNSQMVARIMDVIARHYRWPKHPSFTPPRQAAVQLPDSQLVAYRGRYEFENNEMLALATGRGRLITLVDGFPDEEFLAEADDRFYSTQRDARVAFRRDRKGNISGYLWSEGGRKKEVPRIGPLFHSLERQPDPGPARTEKIATALKAIGTGGKAITESPLLTPGLRADFATGNASRDLANVRTLTFVTEEDVAGRSIVRHKGAVSRILLYRLMTDTTERNLLVHLTADGLVTDYDIVED